MSEPIDVGARCPNCNATVMVKVDPPKSEFTMLRAENARLSEEIGRLRDDVTRGGFTIHELCIESNERGERIAVLMEALEKIAKSCPEWAVGTDSIPGEIARAALGASAAPRREE